MSAVCPWFSRSCSLLAVLATAFVGPACGRSSDVVIGLRAFDNSLPLSDAGNGPPGVGGSGPFGRDASLSSDPDSGAFPGPPLPDGVAPDAAFLCQPLPALPTHLYTFEDMTTTVTDSVGGAHGTLLGTAVPDGTGLLNLDALGYVDLPNGLISSLSHLTVAVWFEWDGGAAFQRIFDFGTTTLGEDPDPAESYRGESYIALTSAFNSGQITYLLSTSGASEVSWDPEPADLVRATQDEPHFAAVVFESGRRISLFLDGEHLVTSLTDIQLSDINDVNVWLGRSQWTSDNPFNGIYDELRIYDAALCADALDTLYQQGPNPNPAG